MITTFTLGFATAVTAGALVWTFVTLYKLNKKFKDMTADYSRFSEQYYIIREDDRDNLSRRFDDMNRDIYDQFVSKEDLKNKKTLLKG